jgi:hypothetical protein
MNMDQYTPILESDPSLAWHGYLNRVGLWNYVEGLSSRVKHSGIGTGYHERNDLDHFINVRIRTGNIRIGMSYVGGAGYVLRCDVSAEDEVVRKSAQTLLEGFDGMFVRPFIPYPDAQQPFTGNHV